MTLLGGPREARPVPHECGGQLVHGVSLARGQFAEAADFFGAEAFDTALALWLSSFFADPVRDGRAAFPFGEGR